MSTVDSLTHRELGSSDTDILAFTAQLKVPTFEYLRNSDRSTPSFLLQLPLEILQNIGLQSLFTRDVIHLTQTCRAIRHAFNDNFFWYKRRLRFAVRVEATGGIHWGGVSKTQPEYMKRWLIKPYDKNVDYRAAVLASSRGFGWCQICCFKEAVHSCEENHLGYCDECLYVLTIRQEDIPFISYLDRSRIRYARTSLTTIRYWRPDIDSEVRRQFDTTFGAALGEWKLFEEKRRAAEMRATKEYRTRQRVNLITHCLSEWGNVDFDKYRPMMPDHNLERAVEQFAAHCVRSLRREDVDKDQIWLRQSCQEFYRFFPRPRDLEDPVNRWTDPVNLNPLCRIYKGFHMERFIRDFDSGNSYTNGHSSQDGKYIIGLCRICYEDPSERGRYPGATVEFLNRRDRRFMSASDLITHYLERHREKAIYKGEEGWFYFLDDVAGLEPRRVTGYWDFPEVGEVESSLMEFTPPA